MTPPPLRERIVCLQSSSSSETQEIGAALAPLLAVGDVVALCGGLGSGKTTFVQGVADGLGVREQVTSPTFTLVRPYACSTHASIRTLLHADLYRLDHLSEVADLGIAELVEEDAVALVEWGDVAPEVLGEDNLQVRLEALAEEGRRINLALRDGWLARENNLRAALEPWIVEEGH